ncbi:hypothetical protein Q8X39_04195 [Leptothrix discophora]|uniref:Toxin CptA n=1 Tax=Leptothrix discophora TaxID=89 RepID=A0ABT9G0I9_LEPDI|nr:hypothetical protein [Leptothrix discophora]
MSVHYPLGPERRWQLALSAAFLLGVVTQLGWWAMQRLAGPMPTTWIFVAWLSLLATLCLAPAFWRLGHPSARALRWRGQAWELLSPGMPPRAGTLDVVIDLGDWLLLRHVPNAPPATPGGWMARPRQVAWLAVSAEASRPRWHALRCALASSRHPASEGRHDSDAA